MPPFDAVTAAPRATREVKLSGETFAMMINLSGRRRFTSQRVVLYSVLARQGDMQALATAREALKLFSEAHVALVQGNSQLPGIFCDELQQAYFGADKNDAQIRAFIDLAQRAMDAVAASSARAGELQDELVQCATPLLAVLNRITQVYEELSKRHAKQVRGQLTGIMNDIEAIARQARMVSFNAQIMAARAGTAGKEFAVVAGVLSDITREIDDLVKAALESSAA